jgi:hypothetical protein
MARRRTPRVLVVLTVVVGLVATSMSAIAVTPEPAAAEAVVPSKPAGLIAYELQNGASQQIWVMERDGSNPRRLTTGDGDHLPRWSPTGQMLMFTRTFEYTGWVPVWDDDLEDFVQHEVSDTATEVMAYDIKTGAETVLVPALPYDPDGIIGPVTPYAVSHHPTGIRVDVQGLYWLPDESGVYGRWSYTVHPLDESTTSTGRSNVLGVHTGMSQPWPGHSSASLTCPGGGPPIPPPGGYGRTFGRPHPDPDANLVAFTASGWCGFVANRVAVGSGFGGDDPAGAIPVTYPVEVGEGVERFAGWVNDGDEIVIEGPARAIWRVPRTGGAATPVTTPQPGSTPWTYQRVHLPAPNCHALLQHDFTVGAGGGAVTSTDDEIVVQQGYLSAALTLPGAPEPVPGGRWCAGTELPTDRYGVFRTTVATGTTIPIGLAASASTMPRNPDIQCRPGSCLTAIRIVKAAGTDLGRPGTYPTEFGYSVGPKVATLLVHGNPFEPPSDVARTVRLPSGVHTVTEAATTGWTLIGITCTKPSAVALSTRSVTVDLADDDGIVTCTFASLADEAPIDPCVGDDCEDPCEGDDCEEDPANCTAMSPISVGYGAEILNTFPFAFTLNGSYCTNGERVRIENFTATGTKPAIPGGVATWAAEAFLSLMAFEREVLEVGEPVVTRLADGTVRVSAKAEFGICAFLVPGIWGKAFARAAKWTGYAVKKIQRWTNRVVQRLDDPHGKRALLVTLVNTVLSGAGLDRMGLQRCVTVWEPTLILRIHPSGGVYEVSTPFNARVGYDVMEGGGIGFNAAHTPEDPVGPRAVAAASTTAVGDGVLMVGTDIEPGRYRAAPPTDDCAWWRLSGLEDTLDDVIANDITSHPAIVQIEPGDLAFESDGCGTWEPLGPAPITMSTTADAPDGMYRIGTDMGPGVWATEGNHPDCIWERSSGFGGTDEESLDVGGSEDPLTVVIQPGDVGFASWDCGTWRFVPAFRMHLATGELVLGGGRQVLTPADVPQCADGVDNDGDGLVDFPEDSACTSPEDHSEVVEFFVPLEVPVLAGVIQPDGTFTVPSGVLAAPPEPGGPGGIYFPPEHEDVGGGNILTVTVEPVPLSGSDPFVGSIDPVTGEATIDLALRVHFEAPFLFPTCYLAAGGIQLALTTELTDPPGPNQPISGTRYRNTTGVVELVANDFAVGPLTGCGVLLPPLPGSDAPPWPAGTNTARFTWASEPILNPVPNNAPTADAGEDVTGVVYGDAVTLDATGSSDPDGDPLFYRWSQVGGPTVELDDPRSATPSFEARKVGTDDMLTFELRVDDYRLDATPHPDVVTVRVDNQDPVADAGADQDAFRRSVVTLDGSGTFDLDEEDQLTYLWTQTDGPWVTLDDATAGSPTFVVPDHPLGTVYEFTITVEDDSGAIDTDTTSVTVVNQSPVADAGADQSVERHELVTLDGTGSVDPDTDEPLSYGWTQTAGVVVELDDATSATPSFTTPAGPTGPLVFELEVTDVAGGTGTDTVTVAVAVGRPDALVGQVTSSAGGPIENARVRLYASNRPDRQAASDTWSRNPVLLQSAFTGAEGNYTFGDGLAPGDYKVRVTEPGHVGEWFDNKSSFGSADVISVNVDTTATANLELVSLASLGSISGTVSSADGPLSGMSVRLYANDSGQRLATALSGAGGGYSFANLAPGSYRMQVVDRAGNYLSKWHGGTNWPTATPVVVAAGENTVVDLTLVTPALDLGSISGVVNGNGGPLEGATVWVYDDAGVRVGSATSGVGGSYEVGMLTPDPSLRLLARDPSGDHLRQWFGGGTTVASAVPVGVTAGDTTVGVDFNLQSVNALRFRWRAWVRSRAR